MTTFKVGDHVRVRDGVSFSYDCTFGVVESVTEKTAIVRFKHDKWWYAFKELQLDVEATLVSEADEHERQI